MFFSFGFASATVPLYNIVCSTFGIDGTPRRSAKYKKLSDPSRMEPLRGCRPVQVRFNTFMNEGLGWKFEPTQPFITVIPGQTALSFFEAYNMKDEETSGLATFTVSPMEAAKYFNKIQCFCFEEQRLKPKERVLMPVFFYLDPDFVLDDNVRTVEEIQLSYYLTKTDTISEFNNQQQNELNKPPINNVL